MVTLCAPPDALDVTPCLLPSDVRPDVPIVYIDDLGLFHFVERIAMRDAQRLVFNTPHLPLPFDTQGARCSRSNGRLSSSGPSRWCSALPRCSGPDLARGDRPPLRSAFLFEVAAGDSAYAGPRGRE